MTDTKKSALKFKEFNSLINSSDSKVYVPLYNKRVKGKFETKTFKEMGEIAVSDDMVEIGLLIPKGVVVLNIDNEADGKLILEIIKQREEEVLVVKTPKGIHVYGISGHAMNTRNNLIALGLRTGTLTEDIGKTYVVTPFKSPDNINPRLAKMDIVYYNGIGKMPNWLTPIYSSDINKPRKTPIDAPIDTSIRENVFKEHLDNLKFSRLTSSEREEVLHIINENLTRTKMYDKDFNNFIAEHNDDELPIEAFYDNDQQFLHYKMGDYLIEYTHAKKEHVSKKLYFYNEREHVYDDNEGFLKGLITNMIPRLKDYQKNEVIKHMDSKLELNTVTFNKDPYLINFKNGVLDLETMKLYPHSPDFLSTVTLNVNYNPNAYSETAVKFFDDATLGNKKLQQLLFEAIGYSFLKTVELEKAFLLTGSGRNGKSTFLNLIKEIVGQKNATTVDFKELASSFGTGGLDGKLVSLAGDISNQRMSESDTFKKIVSGDQIKINAKYEKKYDATVFTKLFFSANDVPKSKDTSFGFYRKLCIIPFHADLRGVTQGEGAFFQRRLLQEDGKEWTAYNAVMAIRNLITTTGAFIEPEVVLEEMLNYRKSNNNVIAWYYQSSYVGQPLEQTGINLHGEYEMWCERNNYGIKNFGNFIHDLENELHIKYDHDERKFTT